VSIQAPGPTIWPRFPPIFRQGYAEGTWLDLYDFRQTTVEGYAIEYDELLIAFYPFDDGALRRRITFTRSTGITR